MPDQADQGQTGGNAERGLRIAKYDAAKESRRTFQVRNASSAQTLPSIYR
jgi:hypothetical protein